MSVQTYRRPATTPTSRHAPELPTESQPSLESPEDPGWVFAPARPLVAHSVRARRAASIFLWVPASGARGLAAIAEPRGPLPDSGLVSCVRPDNERDQNPHITRMRS